METITELVLDDELVDKWIAALRSGEFTQGVGVLKSEVDDSYCCLGVLCEVAGVPFKPAIPDEVAGEEADFNINADVYLGLAIALSGRYSHVNKVGEDWDVNWVKDKLIYYNDNSGASFNDIADWIEGNLK